MSRNLKYEDKVVKDNPAFSRKGAFEMARDAQTRERCRVFTDRKKEASRRGARGKFSD